MPNDRSADRQYRSTPVSFQTREEAGELIIACYFAVFNTDYEMAPGCIERVAPGAFSSWQNEDVRALVDHDTRLVLGRTTVGTLTLREDLAGLYGEIKINRHDSDAMNLYARVLRGDVSQCSFGFDIVREDYVLDPDGKTCTYIIREVVLWEVSIVTFPAYAATSAVARSAASAEALHVARLARRKKDLLERIKKNA